MRVTYLRFLAMAFLAAGVRLLQSRAAAPFLQPEAIERIKSSTEPETRLAAGMRLNLSECGLYELEMVPGISDSLAERILAARSELLLAAAGLSKKKAWPMWRRVRGIGETMARRIARYIDITK